MAQAFPSASSPKGSIRASARNVWPRGQKLIPSSNAGGTEPAPAKYPLEPTRVARLERFSSLPIEIPRQRPLQVRLQGVVRLKLNVGADGEITSITALAGHPLLVPAAMEAVKQWRYEFWHEPTTITVDVPFVLP